MHFPFLVLLAVIMGSIPSGLIVTRAVTGRDIRRYGGGNIGASNVATTAGPRAGILVGVLDIVKGALPVILGLVGGVDSEGLALVALAAVLGHDFSVFLRFRGGKGVATSLGVALALSPLAAIIAMGTWLLALLISKYTSLASLIALASLPVYEVAAGRPPEYVLLTVVLFLLTFGKHWENIIRLADIQTRPFERQFPVGGGRRSQ
jgi:glycerol-3-phosphate acyltransferase PlsY